jgi:hypothetical protein
MTSSLIPIPDKNTLLAELCRGEEMTGRQWWITFTGVALGDGKVLVCRPGMLPVLVEHIALLESLVAEGLLQMTTTASGMRLFTLTPLACRLPDDAEEGSTEAGKNVIKTHEPMRAIR